MAEDPKLVLLKWHADTAHLRDLLHQEGWDVYLTFLAKVEAECLENVLTAAPGPQTEYRKGYVQGLRRARDLPLEVIKNTQEARTH